MNISWYPGHMHKASKEMTRLMGRIDMMIEVLDATIPERAEAAERPDETSGSPLEAARQA